jgi:hypothetical protein
MARRWLCVCAGRQVNSTVRPLHSLCGKLSYNGGALMAKRQCPHCQSQQLDDSTLVEGLEDVARIVLSPTDSFATAYRHIKSRISAVGGLIIGKSYMSSSPIICRSCKGYAIECSFPRCKHVFKYVGKPKPGEVVICPECGDRLMLDW